MEGNAFAQLMLILWIPLGIVIGQSVPPQRACMIVLLGGILFLPEKVGFDLPLLDLNKQIISGIAAYFAVAMRQGTLNDKIAKRMFSRLAWVMCFCAIMTTVTNTDRLVFGSMSIPGLTISAALPMAIRDIFRLLLPFYLGSALFKDSADLKLLMRYYAVAVLIYVPFMLVEVRLAPILHTKVYGFFQHSWMQMRREGGFRPIAFMAHGLAVAMIASTGLIASAGLLRLQISKVVINTKILHVIFWGTLVGCKSLAALSYSVLCVPATFLLSAKNQLKVARLLAGLVLVFPVLRLLDLVPTEWILEQAGSISTDRRASLEFRFDNEDILLARARERILFGWGGWGRNRVYDLVSGEDLSTTDGHWIITLGGDGVIGFILKFGMLVFPVFLALRVVRNNPRDSNLQATASIGMMVAAYAADLIPNGLFQTFPYMLAGALYRSSIGSGPARNAKLTQR